MCDQSAGHYVYENSDMVVDRVLIITETGSLTPVLWLGPLYPVHLLVTVGKIS